MMKVSSTASAASSGSEHPAAVTVQGLGVLVVGGGQAGQVAGHDGRDDLAVVHAQTVVESPAYWLVVS
jgi:hypothetical protein